MIAFKVETDGADSVTTGVDDWSILALHIVARRKEEGSSVRDAYVECSVGGLTLPNVEDVRYHFRWPMQGLKVGSIMKVTVVEVEEADPPAKRFRSDSEVQESSFTDEEIRNMRYQDYLTLKAEFEPAAGG